MLRLGFVALVAATVPPRTLCDYDKNVTTLLRAFLKFNLVCHCEFFASVVKRKTCRSHRWLLRDDILGPNMTKLRNRETREPRHSGLEERIYIHKAPAALGKVA